MYIRDGWNWCHLLGSYFLASMLFKITLLSPLIVLGLGLVWEILDEVNKKLNWNVWFLDDSGFDSRDLLMDIIGIIIFLIGGKCAG